MNIKKCCFIGCNKPYRRNGYCANHSQKFKRGTLFKAPFSKVCEKDFCFKKHYCSGLCIIHFKRKEIKNLNSTFRSNYEVGDIKFTYKEHSAWARSVKRFYKKDKCFLCGWNEAPCDVHHIIPKSQGGLNTLENGIILCPNHHKLADMKKISAIDLQNLVKLKIKSLMEEPKEEINNERLDY